MNFLRRLFRRRKPALLDRRRANDWAPGDLAQCIAVRFFERWAEDPELGEVRRVSNVIEAVGNSGVVLSYFLQFEGYGQKGWEHIAFRKLRPTNDPAEEGWFERTMIEHRPVETPEPVS